MSTCKDCLHFEVCKLKHRKYFAEETDVEYLCNQFKPKADYAPVVRCKECKYLIPEKMICTHIGNRTFNTGFITFGNHFCSYGERK